MTQVNELSGLRHVRQGTCHRCGWGGMVGRFSRNERRQLPTGRDYDRLCTDCASDLTRSTRPSRPVQSVSVRPRPTGVHRNVA
jgi:hypothetical protein